MRLTKPEQNASRALAFVLKKSGVPVTASSLERALMHHPDFPGITAFPDVLAKWQVPAMAVRIGPDDLPRIPLPAIAYLHTENGMFAPVVSVGDQDVTWHDTERGLVVEPQEIFFRKWTGVTLLLEPGPQSGEADYTQKRSIEIRLALKLPVLILTFLFLVGLFLSGITFSGSAVALLGIKALGCFVSALLCWYGIDSSNTVLRSVCQLNGKTSCSSVLRSDGARVIAGITWSDIGLVYFGGTFLALAWALSTHQATALLPGLNLLSWLAVPYSFYSVYYQAFRVRQWCVLCLTVLALLWAEALTGLSSGFPDSWQSLTLLLPSFVLMTSVWMLLKPLLEQVIRVEPLEKSLQRLKFEPAYLRSLFSRQRYIPPAFNNMKVGTLGNPEAPNQLIMVTNPTCQACAFLHGELQNVVARTPDLLVHLFIAANPAGEDGLVARAILGLPEGQIPAALHDWFSHKHEGAERWVRRQATGVSSEEQLTLHSRWAELAGVTKTPFLVLNGIELPSIYSMGELGQLCRMLAVSEPK